MTKPSNIDWNGVELEYRAGIKTLAAIGSQFGVTDAGIIKRAKKEGWTRDLKIRIKAATEAKLAELASPERLASEELVVEENANLQTSVVVSHRKDIGQARALGGKLFAEVQALTDNREFMLEIGEIVSARLEGDVGEKIANKMVDAFHKVISMPGRVSSYKALTDAIKTMIGLERQAYGLADNSNGEADKPEQKTEMSENETARRLAFLLTSAMHKQNKGE